MKYWKWYFIRIKSFYSKIQVSYFQYLLRLAKDVLEKLKEKIINFYQYRNLKVELINLNFLNMLKYLIIIMAHQLNKLKELLHTHI